MSGQVDNMHKVCQCPHYWTTTDLVSVIDAQGFLGEICPLSFEFFLFLHSEKHKMKQMCVF